MDDFTDALRLQAFTQVTQAFDLVVPIGALGVIIDLTPFAADAALAARTNASSTRAVLLRTVRMIREQALEAQLWSLQAMLENGGEEHEAIAGRFRATVAARNRLQHEGHPGEILGI